MLKKTLLALAVMGAFSSAPAMAESDVQHSSLSESTWSSSESTALKMDATPDMSAPSVEIGDGVRAATWDDSFDGYAAEEAMGVGATASSSGTGAVSFASGEGASSSMSSTSVASVPREEVFLLPAPLAEYDGSRHWKLEVSPTTAAELDRHATENVYVATRIDDAIVDPQVALTEGPDGIMHALSGDESTG